MEALALLLAANGWLRTHRSAWFRILRGEVDVEWRSVRGKYRIIVGDYQNAYAYDNQKSIILYQERILSMKERSLTRQKYRTALMEVPC
jgi:hypothetical protein